MPNKGEEGAFPHVYNVIELHPGIGKAIERSVHRDKENI